MKLEKLDRVELQSGERELLRKMRSENNPRLDAIVRGFKCIVKKKGPEHYKEFRSFVPPVYTAQDIAQFSLILFDFQHYKHFPRAGKYLSALIDGSREEEFNIYTRHLDRLIPCIGYENRKKTRVNGNIGDKGACCMIGGEFDVSGDVGDEFALGKKGGTAIVQGRAGNCFCREHAGGHTAIHSNVGNLACCFMKGGIVAILGDAGYDTVRSMEGGSMSVVNVGKNFGNCMRGGTARIGGEYISIGKYACGDIYHKGKLIVKDGKFVDSQPQTSV